MSMRAVIVFLAAALPQVLFAQSSDEYQCTMDGAMRRVEIVRETNNPVPCQVVYHKDTEAPGQSQVLWNAANEAGYCQARAEEFLAQLRSWGWQCGMAAAAASGDDN